VNELNNASVYSLTVRKSSCR